MRRMVVSSAAFLLTLMMMGATGTAAGDLPSDAAGGPPATPKDPVVVSLHGYRIVDDYRWLEDWSDLKVRRWSEAQNAYARGVLDAEPSRRAIQERVEALMADTSPTYSQLETRHGVVFAIKAQPPKQQALLVSLTSVDDPSTERVVLDPNHIDPSGATTIDFYVTYREVAM